MSRLSSLLVQDGALPVKRMEQAFQRQVIYGGSLDTNLLEMGALGEDVLVSYLARATGIAAAPANLLALADPLAARALPKAVAERFAAAPLSVLDGRLRVVVNDPPEHAWAQAIGRLTGFAVEPLVTTEVRLHQLLERQYAQPIPPRLAALVAKLGPAGEDAPPTPVATEAPAAVPAVSDPADEASAAPQGAWIEPGKGARRTAPLGRVSFGVEEEGRVDALAAVATAGPDPFAEPPSGAPGIAASVSGGSGPIPVPVEDGPPVSMAITQPIPWRVPTPAAGGYDGAAPEVESSLATDPTVPIQTQAAPAAPAVHDQPTMPLPAAAMEAELARSSGGGDGPPEGADAALALARERLASAPDRDAIFDSFAALGAAFLEYVAVLTVHGTSVVPRVSLSAGELERFSSSSAAIDPQPGSVLLQTIEGGAPYLGPVGADVSGGALLERLGRPSLSSALLLPVSIKGRVVLVLYGDRARRPVSVPRVAPLLPFAQTVADAFLRLIVAAKSRHATTPPPVSTESTSAAAGASVGAGDGIAEAAPLAVHRQPTRLFGVAPAVTQSAAAAQAAPGMIAAQPTMMLPRVRGATVATPPDTRAASAMPAAAPPVQDLEVLVAVADTGDTAAARAAAESLLDLGPEALAVVMRRFPGRLLVDPRAARGRLPPSQHGPLVALVARFGVGAVQALVGRLQDPNPLVRFYATYLFAEVRAPEAVRHLHWRLYDADPLVRSAAVDALRTYEGTAGLRAVLESLRADLVDPDVLRRQVAAEALGEMRDVEAVPRLIEVACSRDAASAHALRSLVLVTRVDFGTSRRRWRAWLDKNRGRHRIEWLLDALLAKEPEHRMGAASELARLAGATFGYTFDLPRRELEEAHARFERWWEREGRARFGGRDGR